jgi:hypothetical protein
MRFFKLKPALQSMKAAITSAISDDVKQMAKIDAMSAEYHKAGNAVKNIGRVLSGKEAIPDIKPNGKLARLVQMPLRAELAVFKKLSKNIKGVIAAMDTVEHAAAMNQTAKKVSALTSLDNAKKAVAARTAPSQDKTKRQEVSV